MSGSYNAVPPPPALMGAEVDSSSKSGEVKVDFKDAMARVKELAAKAMGQNAGAAGVDAEDGNNRKRQLGDEEGTGGDDREVRQADYSRDNKRALSSPEGFSQPKKFGLGTSEQQSRTAYNHSVYGPGSSALLVEASHAEDFTVPNRLVSWLIGPSGETLKKLQLYSSAKLRFAQDYQPTDLDRHTTCIGTIEAVRKCREMVDALVRGSEDPQFDEKSFFERHASSLDSTAPTGVEGIKKILYPVPGNKVGLVIGRGGDTIRELMELSGARMNVVVDNTIPLGSDRERLVNIQGMDEQINKAKDLINKVINGEFISARGSPAMGGMDRGGYEKTTIQVPTDKVGLVIGRGGERIKSLMQQTGTKIFIELPEVNPPPLTRNINISGTRDNIEYAKSLIYEKVDGQPSQYNPRYNSSYQDPYTNYSQYPTSHYPSSYSYYPQSQETQAYSYPYPTTSTPAGNGAEGQAPQAGAEGYGQVDQNDPAAVAAYEAYVKQYHDYYKAYYQSLGYSYPLEGQDQAQPQAQGYDQPKSAQGYEQPQQASDQQPPPPPPPAEDKPESPTENEN